MLMIRHATRCDRLAHRSVTSSALPAPQRGAQHRRHTGNSAGQVRRPRQPCPQMRATGGQGATWRGRRTTRVRAKPGPALLGPRCTRGWHATPAQQLTAFHTYTGTSERATRLRRGLRPSVLSRRGRCGSRDTKRRAPTAAQRAVTTRRTSMAVSTQVPPAAPQATPNASPSMDAKSGVRRASARIHGSGGKHGVGPRARASACLQIPARAHPSRRCSALVRQSKTVRDRGIAGTQRRTANQRSRILAGRCCAACKTR
jgi:hypothetical protein